MTKGIALAAPFSLAVSAALLALVWMTPMQNRLLYFPETAPLEELTAGGLRAWPDARNFRALLAEAGGTPRATLLLFHGNAGHAGHRRFYATALVPAGVRVLLAEYPAYGARSGNLGEAALVSDAREILVEAYARYGAPIVVAGESLGAAVAAEAAAAERDRVAGLWLITPWDRLASVARHHYPWAPLGLLLRDRYDTTAHLASFDRPVLVDVAERDEIVPSQFGQALYESLKAPKRLRVFPGAGHNDWPMATPERWWREAIEFLLEGPASD